MRKVEIKDIKLEAVYVVKNRNKGDFVILTTKKNEEIVHGKILAGEAVTEFPSKTVTKRKGDIVGFNPNFARMKELEVDILDL